MVFCSGVVGVLCVIGSDVCSVVLFVCFVVGCVYRFWSMCWIVGDCVVRSWLLFLVWLWILFCVCLVCFVCWFLCWWFGVVSSCWVLVVGWVVFCIWLWSLCGVFGWFVLMLCLGWVLWLVDGWLCFIDSVVVMIWFILVWVIVLLFSMDWMIRNGCWDWLCVMDCMCWLVWWIGIWCVVWSVGFVCLLLGWIGWMGWLVDCWSWCVYLVWCCWCCCWCVWM